MDCDPFLDRDEAVSRLIREYSEYDHLIVAFDFDDTVFDFHNVGRTYLMVIDLLKRARAVGCYLTLFTDWPPAKQGQALRHLAEIDLLPDFINETPDFVPFTLSGKPYYNILLDDRAGLDSAADILTKVVEYAEARLPS